MCVAALAGMAAKASSGTLEAEPPGRAAEAVMTHDCGADWETALAKVDSCEQVPGLLEWLWCR